MNLNQNDQAIFNRIKEVSQEEWFLTGEDNPHEELIRFLQDSETSNPHLEQLIYLTESGPDSTDVHIDSQELIADLLDEGHDEAEIRESNREMFSIMRAQFLQCLEE